MIKLFSFLWMHRWSRDVETNLDSYSRRLRIFFCCYFSHSKIYRGHRRPKQTAINSRARFLLYFLFLCGFLCIVGETNIPTYLYTNTILLFHSQSTFKNSLKFRMTVKHFFFFLFKEMAHRIAVKCNRTNLCGDLLLNCFFFYIFFFYFSPTLAKYQKNIWRTNSIFSLWQQQKKKKMNHVTSIQIDNY